MSGLFSPTRYVTSIERVDLEELRAQGKRALLLDRDNTLVPRGRVDAPPSVVAWLDRARELNFEMCIVSNNWHADEVARSAAELGVPSVCRAMKPAPWALASALRRLGVPARETVMVGDQLYTDVWAGNLAGIETILVRPQTTSDLWYTQLLRIVERRALRDLRCEE